uniref:Uncharacterized protein n=1 Tax=Amphimedon queenslandica TaxID=400682 RepID=A0A1X7ULC1_AMPQE
VVFLHQFVHLLVHIISVSLVIKLVIGRRDSTHLIHSGMVKVVVLLNQLAVMFL